MKFGLAGWHYSYRTISQNADFFLSNGFDAFSALGNDFYNCLYDERESEALAEAIIKHDGILTVHYGLPDPKKPETVDKFYTALDMMYDWQKKYGRIKVLSFDVWFDEIFRFVKDAVLKFKDTPVKLGFEDYCLKGMTNETEEFFSQHKFYELLDLGHMNIRLFTAGDNSKAMYKENIGAIPLPIVESHIHNNSGLKDMHMPVLDGGTVNVQDIMDVYAELNLDDVIMTVETMPYLYGHAGTDGDKSVLADLAFVKDCYEKSFK